MKDKVNRMGGKATDQEKIFAKDSSHKGLLPKIYKRTLELNNNKTKQVN